ncbi:MAG: glycosyltransferase family 2 protein [Bacilli bacterium]|nr:glycosyltransferase family 2 protein [Bacilli bacterium]
MDLISIVVPVYNCEKYLKDTIGSVILQTYGNWELILVNDCSKDKSLKVLKDFSKKDKRIRYINLNRNQGVSNARNVGVKEAKGKYLCFLDGDDVWVQNKLEIQLDFMKEKGCAFSFGGYEYANAECIPTGKKVYVPKTVTYKQALKNTIISTDTVMFDMSKIDKSLIFMPNVKCEDTATWWKILKSGYTAYGMNEILAYYRRMRNTLSSNKFKSAKNMWLLYRKYAELNIFASFYNFCFYAYNAIKKRI